ncbi:UDP-glucose 4-epimerase GalE [Carboxydothermus ferrireducens]|uniref:UDP-glucose 4-epimerase n=1 Tax=Carboxydothermus ferrireducens DSM 11255 TaxID=1119529 RepID=A0ABX2R8F6_9THEO|nr:UDP-glucose 4-epimerase GalE [Carboxydothermus ferrireducens]NYE56426.1 UDP-glucose 4-epimerase [Carboxydothermus ferrireducens DSM 11255]
MILVTGGAGYIGSHIVRQLCLKNEKVLVVDNLSKGHKKAVDIRAKLIVGDFGDENLLLEIFKKYDIKAVIHMAAQSLVGESMSQPEKYFEENISKTLSLLKVMLKANVKKMVFSSTAAVYGEPEKWPITEDFPQKPTNVYGYSKLVIEQCLEWYRQIHGFNYVSLRYFNAAGADPSGDIGEDHNPETHLIPLIFKVILGEQEELTVFGTDYPTPDGTCIRDYIHVNDLAEAHILALNKLNKDESGVYNLGNQKGFSVKEIIKVAEEVTGVKVKVRYGQRRPGDPAVLVASSEKIQKELNFTPKFGDIKTIVQTAWEWHKNNPRGYDR